LQAEEVYLRAMQRLLNVNRWNAFNSSDSGKYQLMTIQGGSKLQNAAEGDFILYKTGSNGNVTEEWFRIERIITKLHVHDRSCSIILRPVQVSGSAEQTTYSFSTDATVTISVQLSNQEVSVGAFAKTSETRKPVATDNGGVYSMIKGALAKVFSFGGPARTRWTALAEGLLA
jgi:hypothetical protein